jgi:hypothetical protein
MITRSTIFTVALHSQASNHYGNRAFDVSLGLRQRHLCSRHRLCRELALVSSRHHLTGKWLFAESRPRTHDTRVQWAEIALGKPRVSPWEALVPPLRPVYGPVQVGWPNRPPNFWRPPTLGFIVELDQVTDSIWRIYACSISPCEQY